MASVARPSALRAAAALLTPALICRSAAPQFVRSFASAGAELTPPRGVRLRQHQPGNQTAEPKRGDAVSTGTSNVITVNDDKQYEEEISSHGEGAYSLRAPPSHVGLVAP
jgi:hypothetical protein